MRRLLLPLAFLAATAAAQPLPLVSPNPQQYGHFGRAVAGVPDGDGGGDLLIGGVGVYGTHLFSGATGALLRSLESPNLVLEAIAEVG